MKPAFLFIAILFVSCATIKLNREQTYITLSKSTICPEDGICTITIEKNKNIVLKQDNFNKIYYESKDDIQKSIIHYQYSRNTETGVQDAGYKEEIIFELSNDYKSQLSFKNQELQNVKMLYGRHCYCKGQAGFFKVLQGELFVKNSGNSTIEIKLNFNSKDIPQIISSIDAVIENK